MGRKRHSTWKPPLGFSVSWAALLIADQVGALGFIRNGCDEPIGTRPISSPLLDQVLTENYHGSRLLRYRHPRLH
jgi:hypothetical protein